MASEEYSSSDPERPRKLCFVTVGATASFNSLIRETLEEPFLEALQENNYTDILIQYGRQGEEIFNSFMRKDGANAKRKYGLKFTGFDFNVNGLRREICSAKADQAANRREGLVISHAGKSAKACGETEEKNE